MYTNMVALYCLFEKILQIYIDSHALSANTKLDVLPLPLIADLIDKLGKSNALVL